MRVNETTGADFIQIAPNHRTDSDIEVEWSFLIGDTAAVAQHDNSIRNSLYVAEAMRNVESADATGSQTIYDGE
jgi:hypothetical protein